MPSRSVSRNPAVILLILTFALLGILVIVGARLPIGQDEAIRREVRLHAASQDIDRAIEAAVKDGDLQRAQSYSDLAIFMGWRALPAVPDAPAGARNPHPGPTPANGAEAAMSRKLGRKTQAIVELTGKHSLNAFNTSLGVVAFVVEHIVGFGAWLIALCGLAIGRRLVPLIWGH